MSMISSYLLLKYKKKADTYLTGQSGLEFNHFGIQAKDNFEYLEYIKKLGGLNSEVVFRDRKIATLINELGIIEIYEPKPNEKFPTTKIDHVAYVADNINKYSKKFRSKAISKFDVGNTHGFKISPSKNITIEIRNNSILDSIDDFRNQN